MANKALATRQRMQFRVEPSQAPAKGRGSQTKKVLPDYLGSKNRNTKPLSPPVNATVHVTAKSTDKQGKD
ncbi:MULTISPECIES: hypothetical protein [Undibacterium]|jgi:hypothetical protein|uniref:Uncharacterized protein n=1 Tax=Undibacterium umbellatum TaxID=2762300 RepID=A0ABR6ZD07_9BURK|nr:MULTISPECIES: hypothetical protein [Undibacterium]MBC3909509.1 hypothetical protein [Undibacterium umbellatum]MDP1980078.1 hypothetical protein [Undibacterium sp.]